MPILKLTDNGILVANFGDRIGFSSLHKYLTNIFSKIVTSFNHLLREKRVR